jgi:2-oxoglutarate ferredoxin oxidoreductase subunit delta
VIVIDDEAINALGYHPARYSGSGCTACGICFYSCPEPGAISVEKDSALVKSRW